ncbi:MAG: hypothetical protein RLZZ301_802 [Bacteroidota bacterium]|jgi:phosphopantetheinyl transferase
MENILSGNWNGLSWGFLEAPYLRSDLTYLFPEELAQFSKLQLAKRKQEFLAIRALRHYFKLNAAIHYQEGGAPYLANQAAVQISISHCASGYLFGTAPFPIGVDVESVTAKALRIAPRFLNAHEHALIAPATPLMATLFWSAKEAMFKLAGLKNVLFSKQLIIHTCERHEKNQFWMEASICDGSSQKAVLIYGELFDGFLLTLARFKPAP